jgi:hypothetical protein
LHSDARLAAADRLGRDVEKLRLPQKIATFSADSVRWLLSSCCAMPGALPILIVAIAIGLAAWIAALVHTRNPAHHDPREDYRRLQRHAAWLEQRLDQARRERWGAAMINGLSDQLGKACQQLARARGGVIHRKSARVR